MFSKLVIDHFIESQSMALFQKGLSIVKNLIHSDPEKALQLINEYDECCKNTLGSDGISMRRDFLTFMSEGLTEALHELSNVRHDVMTS